VDHVTVEKAGIQHFGVDPMKLYLRDFFWFSIVAGVLLAWWMDRTLLATTAMKWQEEAVRNKTSQSQWQTLAEDVQSMLEHVSMDNAPPPWKDEERLKHALRKLEY
jgi:hypothetical protein